MCIRDSPTAIKAQLVEAGVPEDQIHDSGLDTAADTKRFYSYRVEKGQTCLLYTSGSRQAH